MQHWKQTWMMSNPCEVSSWGEAWKIKRRRRVAFKALRNMDRHSNSRQEHDICKQSFVIAS
eukprot:515868-Amphidinium_carterae.1